jgi:hypothetical protein
VTDFRAHVARGFQDLPPLAAEERNALPGLFKSVPDDSLFWGAVEDADHLIRDAEKNRTWLLDDYEHMWSGQYFRERFTEQPEALTESWAQSGLDVLEQLHVLRV